MSFIDELRRAHPEVQQPKLLINDAIEFISRQDSLKTRRHLTRIFRLRCLCLDEPRFSFPAVRFGSVRTDEPACTMFDVVAPIQSHYGNVVRGLDSLVSESSIARLLNLELTFGTTGLSDTYSPWENIDYIGRDRIRDSIHLRSPERRKVTISAAVSSEQPGSSKSGKSPSPKKSNKF